MVAVLIVNWNTGDLLARCLHSLDILPEAHLIDRVYVVDNASSDTSLVRAQKNNWQHIRVDYQAAPRNLGFAKAVNLAWQKVGKNDDVLLLNPDTEVRPGAVRALLAQAEEGGVGIVGPKLIYPDGSGQSSVRRFPTLLTFIWLWLKLHRIFSGVPWWQRYLYHGFDAQRVQRVDQVMGAAFLIHRRAWHQIGFLDDNFYLWFEEVDYCARVREAGLMVVYTPHATVVHYGAASFHQVVGWTRTWPFLRSSLRYARKHLGWLAVGLLWLLIPLSILLILPSTGVHLWQRFTHKHRVLPGS